MLSDILLSNNNSDTIILLETLKTKYLPLISNSRYDSSLFIEGLEVYINQNNNGTESNYLKDDIDEILDNLFFDNLNVSNSNLFIVNDTIQHSIDINTLIINKIKRNINGINFDISMFQGGVDEYLIENFETNFELNNDFVSLENLYLSDVNQFLEGDLNFYFNQNFSIKNFNDSNLRFKLKSEFLNINSNEINLPDFISGEIDFSGSKNNFLINRALFITDFFRLDSKINVENGFSSNPNVKIDINNLDFKKENINSVYEIDNRIDYPSMYGNIELTDNKISYKLNQVDESKTIVDIKGTAELDDILSYKISLNTELHSNDQILNLLNLNSLKINSNITGTTKQLSTIESSIFILKNDKDFVIDVNSFISNNDLIAQVDIVSENIIINSNVLGNNLNKMYNIDTDIDIINISDSEFLNFKNKSYYKC